MGGMEDVELLKQGSTSATVNKNFLLQIFHKICLIVRKNIPLHVEITNKHESTVTMSRKGEELSLSFFFCVSKMISMKQLLSIIAFNKIACKPC